MQVDVIERREDLSRLKDDWERVYGADPEGQFFLSWIWISNWLHRALFPWVVLAAREDEEGPFVAFLPLHLRTELDEKRGLYNSIRMGASYFAVYTGFLCLPENEAEALPAFASRIQETLNWTRLHLDDLFAAERRRKLFLDAFAADGFVAEKIVRHRHFTSIGEDIDHDVYIYVDLPDSWEEYLDSQLGPRTRRDVRNFLRKADAADDFRITVADSSTTEHALDTFVRFWTAQWEAKAPGYARSILGNCRNMLPPCAQAGRLFVPVLWQGDVPIGVHVAFIDREKRSLVCFLVGRDTSVKKPPPGLVLHAFSIRWAIENGFRTYDLGTGDFSYKYRFGSRERLVEGVRVLTKDGTNLGGRLDRRSLPAALSWIRRLLAERRFYLAAIGCKQVLAAAPDNAEAEALLRQVETAAANRALGLRWDGKLADAAQACRQILEVDPGHADARRLLNELEAEMQRALPAALSSAKQFHQRGQIAEAENAYRAILKANPNHFEASYLLGLVFLQQHKFESAERQIGLAIRLQPNVAASHYNRGLALMHLGRREEALASFDSAIALKPDYAFAITQRDNILKNAQV
ncbi:GNAT family N-acetyltransferase [Bradyrhizobium sp.]|uniref:GNAT family N-acetyltransferase n=1 Tax=Bradyrhizobium sp. TaxID=376 RepID=UPI0040378FB0